MTRLKWLACGVALFALLSLPSLATTALAQATGGNIDGKATDQQGGVLRGVTITAHNGATGFERVAITDSLGRCRITGLPVGAYDVRAELTSFATQTLKSVQVDVGTTAAVEFKLAVAGRTEEVTVAAPAVDVQKTSVGQVIAPAQIENLPLNGRQFGNLGALVPGVGLGFHNDPTKSSQYAPQVAGGTGRNINYQIDGGDNNDDTVGGLVQNFPLDSVGQFNFSTYRFRAEYGRSYGGVLSVVTKSGTNTFAGSLFNYFRDRSLNARTSTEKNNDVPKGDYRRWQYGGSLGGPIVRNRTHFFGSVERTQQDTTQSVNTGGLFPEKDGVFALPYRENISVGKLTHQLSSSNFLTMRYGFNNNSQPYGPNPLSPPDNWGTSTNTFHSLNVNLSSVRSGTRLNELLFQYSYFNNHIGENSTEPYQAFPGGVVVGQNPNTPQDTLQKTFQFRDDFTWTSGRHQWKRGVEFIAGPTLEFTFMVGQSPAYILLQDSVTSPVSVIHYNGPTVAGGTGGGKVPNKQYGFYLQDAWRLSDRLLVDLDVRYDLIS